MIGRLVADEPVARCSVCWDRYPAEELFLDDAFQLICGPCYDKAESGRHSYLNPDTEARESES